MDDIIAAIASATFRLQDLRIVLRAERELGMDRLSEKLALAAQVVATETKKLEDDADKLIARGAEFSKRRQRSFSAQHAVLDSGTKGMDALDSKLGLLSNDPFPSSGNSSDGQPEPPEAQQLNPLDLNNPNQPPAPSNATPLPPKPSPIAIPTEPPKPLHDGIDRFVREQANSRIVGVVAVPARRWLR